MPITDFQRQVLQMLKKTRNPESYVAGGTVIQRHPESSRYSTDIDFFHDTDEAVTTAYSSDRAALLAQGFSVETLITQPSFYRAMISRGMKQLKLEWVRDTAFRFFPVLDDDDFGYRLHDVDLAINKCLALANRIEVRDVLDMIEIDQTVLSLAGCVWAACGKDPGFTPQLLLNMIQRHSIITPDKLAQEDLRKPIDPAKVKRTITRLIESARQTVGELNPNDIGCVYLDAKLNVVRDVANSKSKIPNRHFGSVKGSWPREAP